MLCADLDGLGERKGEARSSDDGPKVDLLQRVCAVHCDDTRECAILDWERVIAASEGV
jgi:hypothetical protein